MQAAFYEDMSRDFLTRAGVCAGMRVLDVGSGTGGFSFLTANLVGPTGDVLGVDVSLVAVAVANKRACDKQVHNVRFIESDAARLHADGAFDAVIGRLILMHFSDPSGVLSALSRWVKPNGIIAFQEPDYSGVRFSASLPLASDCLSWISSALRRVGANPDVGLQLQRVFTRAGLPKPLLSVWAGIGGGEGFPGYEMTAELVRSLLPSIEQYGIASRSEIDVDTLASRLLRETVAADAVVVMPAIIGAWVRLAGAT
jgi:ubiquinone/menaquinone biosynthesis C-methylase UbiE